MSDSLEFTGTPFAVRLVGVPQAFHAALKRDLVTEIGCSATAQAQSPCIRWAESPSTSVSDYLAYLDPETRKAMLTAHLLHSFTDKTITDPVKLQEEVAKIRQQGYSISHGEWTIDASGVAAPIFNQRGDMLAALTISGPTQRFDEASVVRFITSSTRTAGHISRLLGYSGSAGTRSYKARMYR